MSNSELCKYYMGLQANTNTMEQVPHTEIISALTKHFGNQWTWEIADERFYADNTNVCTTVTLYTPGRIYVGRAFGKIVNYPENHLHALVNACQTFMSKQTAPVTAPSQPIANQQMTPDQIMSAIGQQPAPAPAPQPQKINTAEEFYNQPTEEVPFDAMTDNCLKELQQEMGMVPADYDVPQAKYKGFTQRQIDRINKFKKEYEILDDKMFGNYVNAWDKTLTMKSQITPDNVDSFLAWVDSLGKMDC